MNTNKKAAGPSWNALRRTFIRVPVVCLLRDFVCAGEGQDAVFMKVHIRAKDYKKALAEGKRRTK